MTDGFNTRSKGDALEMDVLAALRSNAGYEAVRSVRTQAGSACSDSDLLVTYHQGRLKYSFVVECKNLDRPIDKGVVFELSARRAKIKAQCAILITRKGLQGGAVKLLAEYPQIAHFKIDEFKHVLREGKLHDTLALLAHSRTRAACEVDEINAVLQSFDVIVNTMALLDGDCHCHLRAAAQLIKAQYKLLCDDCHGQRRFHLLSEVLPECSRDVQLFLSQQSIRHNPFVRQWLLDSHEAAASLLFERRLYEASDAWQGTFYKM